MGEDGGEHAHVRGRKKGHKVPRIRIQGENIQPDPGARGTTRTRCIRAEEGRRGNLRHHARRER